MSRQTASLTFVTRQGCSVCDEVLARLRAPARLLRVPIEEVDVDSDRQFEGRFGGRVPVVLAGDHVLAEGRVTAGEAWRAAWRARRR